MSEEKELKLACLHQAGGDLDHAQRLFDWVSGSVRATPDSEAAEVSAPKQDKPQQSFNYRHPSKYGTDVPRRCYLEELTPEERAIRDLVDTVERLGAHPLLTATVIQLMKAGEDLADWVDIGLRDKDIAALSPGNDLGLLDENPAAGVTEVRNQAEGEAPLWQVHEISSDDICAVPSKEIGEAVAAWGNVTFAPTHEYDPHINFVVEPWAGDAETHEVDLGASWLAQYAFNMRGEPIDWLNNPPRGGKSEPEGGKGPSGGEPSADAERTEDALLENQPGVSSQASLAEAAVPEGWTPAAEFQFDGLIKANQRVPVVMALYEDGVSCPGGNGIIGAWTFPVRDVPVIAYRIIPTPPGLIEASADAERIEDARDGTPSTEQTEHDRPKLTNEEFESLEKLDGVLDAEPSPILRSEVPPAAETYLAPSGDEFATVNGQTHLIVSDEAEAQGQAETAPQAAYAPIHNEDDLFVDETLAGSFARGPTRQAELAAEAELEPEQASKPKPSFLGLFGVKAKAEEMAS